MDGERGGGRGGQEGGGEWSGVEEEKGTVSEQGRIHDCSCRGRLGRGSDDMGRSSNDLGRGMLKYKLSNP